MNNSMDSNSELEFEKIYNELEQAIILFKNRFLREELFGVSVTKKQYYDKIRSLLTKHRNSH